MNGTPPRSATITRLAALLVFSVLAACGDAQAERLPAAPGAAVAVLGEGASFTASWGAGALEASEDPEVLARCVTTGAGDLSMVTTQAPLSEPVDFRGRFLAQRLRIDDVSRVSALELRLMSGSDDYFVFQAPFFSDLEFNAFQKGTWLDLTLSFGEARRVGSPRREAIDRVVFLVRDRGAGESRQASLAHADQFHVNGNHNLENRDLRQLVQLRVHLGPHVKHRNCGYQ